MSTKCPLPAAADRSNPLKPDKLTRPPRGVNAKGQGSGARFLTPEIIRNFCIIGEPPALVEQLKQLERDGLKQVTFLPPFAQRFEITERFARQVMAKM